MHLFILQKRDGTMADFVPTKITKAITKACVATATPLSEYSITGLTATTLQRLTWLDKSIISVEDVQDAVESTLMHSGYDKVAKAYIRYRYARNQAREEHHVMIDVPDTMNEYLDRSDRRVNANANSGYSLGGLILNTAGKVTANYWLSHIYPKQIGALHRNGDYHIHDLDIFGGYCAGRSLRQLLEEGLNGVSTRLESTPPKNLQSAVNQMVNFLGTLQNERAGAQAFSSFDTYLAPFVHKYRNSLETMLEKNNRMFKNEDEKQQFLYDKTYKYVVQQMQNLIFGLNVPSRWGTQTPFTNITLDLTCPDDLKEKYLLLGGTECGAYPVPFGDLEAEMDMINKALVEVYTKGDAKDNVFTFPIPTYNITEEFDRDRPIVNDIMEMTAKYGIPYFQNFVGSQWMEITDKDGNKQRVRNPKAYTPGAVRSMCCRLQLDLTELTKRGNGLFGSAEMTGSIGVVTINLARLGYLYAGDKQAFIDRLSYLMFQAKSSLEIKRKELTKWLKNGLFPYTKRYLHSYRNHFSTIGINGMNEAIRNFTNDQEDISTERGKQFALDILDFMRETLKAYQEETGNLYNLEATPAEGTTYRFAKEDQKQRPEIIQAGTQQAPYYTNSTQLPVSYTNDAFEALTLQNELQCNYTGGTVLHLYLGERVTNANACKALIKKVLGNYQLPYITITPTFSICPHHGYIPGEHDYCPRCDEEIGYKGSTHDATLRTPHLEAHTAQ